MMTLKVTSHWKKNTSWEARGLLEYSGLAKWIRQPYRWNQAVGILLRVANKLPHMPQLPTNIFRRCLPSLLPTDYIRRWFTESFEIFTVHAKSSMPIPSVITFENTVGHIPSVKFSREFFWHALPSVRPSMFVFFISTEVGTGWGITDDWYSDGRILSVMLSVRILSTNYVPYTDGINLSIKLFNSVVGHVLGNNGCH